MRDLTPQIAVTFADAAYDIRSKKGSGYTSEALDLLSRDFDFNLSNNVVQGTIGSVLEHIFQYKK